MLHKLALFAVAIFLLFGRSAAQPATRTGDIAGWYRVTISNDLLAASVEAEIPVTKGKLFMAPWGADHLPAGWGTFVREFQAHDRSDRALSFDPKPNDAWQLASEFTGMVRLTYKVDLSFTKTKWP